MTTATKTTILRASIRVLTVGPDTLTTAMFDQLPERPFDPEVGTIWGWVNRHSGQDDGGHPDCRITFPNPAESPGWNHRHFVWQDGGRLYRSTIEIRPQQPAMTATERDATIAENNAEHLQGMEQFKRSHSDELARLRNAGATEHYINRGGYSEWHLDNAIRDMVTQHEGAVARIRADYQADQDRRAKHDHDQVLWDQVDAAGQVFTV